MEMGHVVMSLCNCLQIRESIKTEQPCTVRILNYRLILFFIFIYAAKAWTFFTGYAESILYNTNRKDKSSFWNLLHISPVRDASGKVILMSFLSRSINLKCLISFLSSVYSSCLSICFYDSKWSFSYSLCMYSVFLDWKNDLPVQGLGKPKVRFIRENIFCFHF